jgi:hypothetical protein
LPGLRPESSHSARADPPPPGPAPSRRGLGPLRPLAALARVETPGRFIHARANQHPCAHRNSETVPSSVQYASPRSDPQRAHPPATMRFPSMGRDVKTTTPHLLVPIVLHPASAACYRVGPRRMCAGTPIRLADLPRVSCDMASRSRRALSIPVDFQAAAFSTQTWEPSFYQGLVRPSLYSALQGGIAYPRGLRSRAPRPEIAWMLSPVTLSSPGLMLDIADSRTTGVSNPETRYFDVVSLRGSYLSCDFHTASAIAAI